MMEEILKTDTAIKRLEKEIEMIQLYIKPLEKIGVDASVINNSFLSMKVDNLKELKKVTKLMPPYGEKYELTFAGKDPVATWSPFSIHASNYAHQDELRDVTIKYKGVDIWVWVTVPSTEFKIISEEVTKTKSRRGVHAVEVDGYNRYVDLGSVQKYAGADEYGSRVSYAGNDLEGRIFQDTFMGAE